MGYGETMTLHKCPSCSKEAVRIIYDDPSNNENDTYQCMNCGWG